MAQRTARLTEEQRRFIDENPYVGVVTTLRKDGSPHSTVVWIDVDDDGTPSFNTDRRRAKARHIESNPRVSLLVLSPEDPFKWVSISGRAEPSLEGADEQIDRLAKKYLGQDEYPRSDPEEQRVSVHIRSEQVDSSGFGS